MRRTIPVEDRTPPPWRPPRGCPRDSRRLHHFHRIWQILSHPKSLNRAFALVWMLNHLEDELGHLDQYFTGGRDA